MVRTLLLACFLIPSAMAAAESETITTVMKPVAPGVWRVTLGEPEEFSPVSVLRPAAKGEAPGALPEAKAPPFTTGEIAFHTNARGCLAVLPMDSREQIYGLGLHLRMFNCTDTRKEISVNDHQGDEDGSSHAPVPFYVSTNGYGVYVDTARYARFYCGNLARVPETAPHEKGDGKIATTTEELYRNKTLSKKAMTIEVPVAKGVDIYLFAGPDMKSAVRRYNLFSGGGCLPPLWGLGPYYRGHGQFKAEDILALARRFRDTKMPFTVFGLEPGWQTQAYSCSYVWSPERWPDPAGFIGEMTALNYNLNLWEHAFVHPTSPLYEPLRPLSGDYEVWKGLVPDFSLPRAREIFGGYHEREFVKQGVTGFKLDECDNQPNKKDPWSFPELSAFPSGMDGEQMHCLIGPLYQRMMAEVFERNNLRTFGKVRSSHALAAPLPFVLYSDHYDHRDYVRGLANCGFGGLLWQPEVRNCDSVEELLRRGQTCLFSPQDVYDCWFLKLPPWDQINTEKNNAGERLPEHAELEAKIRQLLEWRMRLVPYLYSAFADYHSHGEPPFRALVMDYPADKNTHDVDDQFLVGPALLVAPLFAGQTERSVYLPAGGWFDFWTGTAFEGGKTHQIKAGLDAIPVFVKEGYAIPLADPVQFITPQTVFNLEVRVYGNAPAAFTLREDDGVSLNPEQNIIELYWAPEKKPVIKRSGNFALERYHVRDWKVMPPQPGTT